MLESIIDDESLSMDFDLTVETLSMGFDFDLTPSSMDLILTPSPVGPGDSTCEEVSASSCCQAKVATPIDCLGNSLFKNLHQCYSLRDAKLECPPLSCETEAGDEE